jgi:hypothetical protein
VDQKARDLRKTLGEDLMSAMIDLTQAQQSWKNSAASDIASGLENLLGTGKRYRDGLAAIDSVYDTSLVNQQLYLDGVKKLELAYAATGNVDVFTQGLKDLRDEFMPTDDAVIAAQTKVDDLQKKLNTLSQTEVKIPVTIDVGKVTIDPNVVPLLQGVVASALAAAGAGGTSSGSGSSATPDIPGGPADYGYAEGGSGIVPPGYPNDSYLIGLTSGENFTVTPPGGSPESGVTITQNFYGNADPKEVHRAARDGVLAAQRATGKR